MTMVLFLLAAVAFTVRFVISPTVMDRLVAYTGEGGAFYEKVHFGSYLILLLLPVTLMARPFRLAGDEIAKFKALFWFIVTLLAIVVVLFLAKRAGASVFLVDTYVTAAAAGLIVLILGPTSRVAMGHFLLLLLILSAVIGIGEAALGKRLMPYDLDEVIFRPLGLSDHPLGLGALSAMAIGFVPLAHWRLWVRIAAIFVLFVGVAASGARFALLIAVAEILVLLLFLPWGGLNPRQTRQAKLIVFVPLLAGGVALIGLLASSGFLGRFGGTLFDENFFARVTVNQAFSLVSWKELLFGMPPADLLALVNKELNLPYIESAQVVIGLTFGIPMALVFLVAFLQILAKLLYRAPMAAWIGTGAIILAGLSNNSFSSKAPTIMILFVLLMAFGGGTASVAGRKT
ncbi:VpsF family polysaccharide biosynthesis protein [Devosia ginsengisoli]|uniref:O-antigen ligase family protein n=1 Tax=Devosia ginsengisoli TaxID=400770 RepID=A0A5B8LPE3_9HYPH|nr:VpsF family polysaccharide biosynthesis protein [Devosia ginsengisoli]QDZ09799.1 hypothetical protein FPZ08_02985 [Devosia ginsengisoli]